MMHFSAQLQQRRWTMLLFVLVAYLLVCEEGVALSVDQRLPTEQAAAEHRGLAPPPSGAVHLVDAAPRPAHVRLHKGSAARRTLVREVDHQDWFQLDGDQLLPLHRAETAPSEVRADGQTIMKKKTTAAAAMTVEPVPFVLAEPRRPAPTSHLHNEHKISKDVGAAPAVDVSPPHIDDGGVDKIALQSLRLVVRLANDKNNVEDDYDHDDEEGEEEERERMKSKKPQLTPVARSGTQGGGQFGAGPAILLSHPRGGGGAARAPVPVRDWNAHRDAAAPRRRDTMQVADAVDKAAMKRTANANLLTGDRSAPGAAGSGTHVYTDEELRRRCVVANGRAADPAVLRAMMEGRLRKDCLVIAADVGNDIPTENNAKGAVTIVSLFVSTLFLVFALVF